MRTKLFILVLLCAVLAVSCDRKANIRFDRPEFERQRNAWERHDLQNYAFDIHYFSGATGPVEAAVTVIDGVVQGAAGEDWFITTISGLYDHIERGFNSRVESIDRGEGHEVSDLILKIDYDEIYNYPKKVSYSVGYVEDIDGGAGYSFTITDFTLLGNSVAIMKDISPSHYYRWRNMEREKAYIVNSQAELAGYFRAEDQLPGMEEMPLPAIDFGKYSLILMHGQATNGIANISNTLYMNSGALTLDTRITLNMTDEAPVWTVALLVNRIPGNTPVQTRVTYTDGSDSPAGVSFTDISPTYYYRWVDMEPERAYIVNSDAELTRYLSGENPLPEIDFGKYSLILMHGQATNGIVDICNTVSIDGNTLLLDTDILLNATHVAQPWNVALLVRKLGVNVSAQATVTYSTGLHMKETGFIDISPENYYRWANADEERVYTVDSEEELKGYLTGQNPLPQIDFASYTLLLAHGSTPNGIQSVAKSLYHNENGTSYLLWINIRLNDDTQIGYWSAAILTPKINWNASVYLDVDMQP